MNLFRCIKCGETFTTKYDLKRTGDVPICQRCELRRYHLPEVESHETVVSAHEVEIADQKVKVEVVVRHTVLD